LWGPGKNRKIGYTGEFVLGERVEEEQIPLHAHATGPGTPCRVLEAQENI